LIFDDVTDKNILVSEAQNASMLTACETSITYYAALLLNTFISKINKIPRQGSKSTY